MQENTVFLNVWTTVAENSVAPGTTPRHNPYIFLDKLCYIILILIYNNCTQ